MGMTYCPECGHDVSTSARSCPECGCVFSNRSRNEDIDSGSEPACTFISCGCWLIILIIGFIVYKILL